MEKFSELFGKLIQGLTEIFHDIDLKIILYGSVARGDDCGESDIDIAVIIPYYTPQMQDLMWDLIVDIELEYDRVLSVLLIDSKKFEDWENVMPFYKNVKKDGIVLWPAA